MPKKLGSIDSCHYSASIRTSSRTTLTLTLTLTLTKARSIDEDQIEFEIKRTVGIVIGIGIGIVIGIISVAISRDMCSKHAVVGLGWLTDHGIESIRDHGWMDDEQRSKNRTEHSFGRSSSKERWTRSMGTGFVRLS